MKEEKQKVLIQPGPVVVIYALFVNLFWVHPPALATRRTHLSFQHHRVTRF